MALVTSSLPDFPWDTLVPARDRAAAYSGPVFDLTIGSPVDPVPQLAREALVEAVDSHGYPANVGTAELRAAIFSWMRRRRNITGDTDVLPTVGSKEMVALLPAMLGFDARDRVAFPLAAYPTYDVGARLAGASPVAIDTDSDPASWPTDISLLWLNSPSNPTGHVHSLEHLTQVVEWARKNDVVVASDECYAELCWDVDDAPSILDDRVCGGDTTGLLMLYSLSKQSNLAGYRAAFIAGDGKRIADLREVRKHAGFLMPGPVQHAMATMLADDAHVAEQRERYRRRREMLLNAVRTAGLESDPESVAGLYLWVRKSGVSAWQLVMAFAEQGIVVAPGTFYGDEEHVRISLTASDETIGAAADRLGALFG